MPFKKIYMLCKPKENALMELIKNLFCTFKISLRRNLTRYIENIFKGFTVTFTESF